MQIYVLPSHDDVGLGRWPKPPSQTRLDVVKAAKGRQSAQGTASTSTVRQFAVIMEAIPGQFPVKEEEFDYEELDRQMHEEYAKAQRERMQRQAAAEAEQEEEELIDGRMELFDGATGERDKQCRICLGGEEDEPELGRLISPCMCDGSMRVSDRPWFWEWTTDFTVRTWYVVVIDSATERQ